MRQTPDLSDVPIFEHLDEEMVEAIREIENRGETDMEAFRDRLITDWSV